MTLAHRVNTTAADVISNISAVRWDNLTNEWGGYNNTTTGPPDFGRIIYYTAQMYPDAMGQIGLLILFMTPFIMMWIGQGDMIPASVVGFFFGIYIAGFVGGAFMVVGIVMMVLGGSLALFSMWMRR